LLPISEDRLNTSALSRTSVTGQVIYSLNAKPAGAGTQPVLIK